MGSALKVAEQCGVAAVARELGIEIVEFEPVEVKYPAGKFFKRFTLGKAVLEADTIINLPKLKTHGLTYLTLAVKNIFGCIPGARKAQWHVRTSRQGSEYFARMLLDLHTLINPPLSIVDGIIAMEGKGPGFGNPRDLGLIIAGTDAVAVDAVSLQCSVHSRNTSQPSRQRCRRVWYCPVSMTLRYVGEGSLR